MLPWYKRQLKKKRCIYVSGMNAKDIGKEVGKMSKYKYVVEVDFSSFDSS